MSYAAYYRASLFQDRGGCLECGCMDCECPEPTLPAPGSEHYAALVARSPLLQSIDAYRATHIAAGSVAPRRAA